MKISISLIALIAVALPFITGCKKSASADLTEDSIRRYISSFKMVLDKNPPSLARLRAADDIDLSSMPDVEKLLNEGGVMIPDEFAKLHKTIKKKYREKSKAYYREADNALSVGKKAIDSSLSEAKDQLDEANKTFTSAMDEASRETEKAIEETEKVLNDPALPEASKEQIRTRLAFLKQSREKLRSTQSPMPGLKKMAEDMGAKDDDLISKYRNELKALYGD